MLINGKTIEYLTLLWLKQPELPLTRLCVECDRKYSWAAEASAAGHGVIVLPDKSWTIAVGCEGFHQFSTVIHGYTVHGPHTLATHEAEMPDCSDPDCEFHHPEVTV